MKNRYTLIEQSQNILIRLNIASHDDSLCDMDCLKFRKWQKTRAYCEWRMEGLATARKQRCLTLILLYRYA